LDDTGAETGASEVTGAETGAALAEGMVLLFAGLALPSDGMSSGEFSSLRRNMYFSYYFIWFSAMTSPS
jgi:hypothetical protein